MLNDSSSWRNLRLGQGPFSTVLDSRWYAFADLACVAVACAFWYFSAGQASWWPLLIALLPWPLRIINRQFPVHRTPFDLYFLLFLITAVVGIWTAYNRDDAWSKFWLIVGAILLFYALAGQPIKNVWPVWSALGILGSLISVQFLFTHDWSDQSSKFASLRPFEQSWMALRPQLSFTSPFLQPDSAVGLMAMLLPALVASVMFFIHRRRWILVAMATFASATLAAGMILSSSRGAWLALVGSLTIWLLWFFSRKLSQTLSLSRRQTFFLLVLLLIIIIGTVTLLHPGGVVGMAQQLPGPNRLNRLVLSQDTINLIRDYPFTGGGLGSFPGLYSQYTQLTPFFVFHNAHNLFLDVAVEQGPFGLIMLLAILGTSIWLLTALDEAYPTKADIELLHGSLLAALTVVLLHGFADDPLYGSNSLLLLFAFSGITTAITRLQFLPITISGIRLSPSTILLTVLIVLGLLVALVNRQPVKAAWNANIGALKMTQIELDDNWPSNRWQGDSKAQQLAAIEPEFHEALKADGANITALYRLGLIALARQDFDTAVKLLSEAQQLNPSHRGVRKALGFSALWGGEKAIAENILSSLPEAKNELGSYAGWWQQQDRSDLSTAALEMKQTLENR